MTTGTATTAEAMPRESAVTATQRVDAADARQAAENVQRAFDNRIRAIAINAVLGSMACYSRTIMTDDDAARVDAIERLLVLRRDSNLGGFVPVVPSNQSAPAIESAVLQAAVEQGLLISNGAKP